MKPGVHVTKDKIQEIIGRMEALTKRDVLVGIPDDDSERGSATAGSATRREVGGKPQDVTNPTLGFVHEFGAPELNIPARPFLIPGLRDGRARYTKYLGAAAKAELDGDSGLAERNLHAAGIAAMNAVQMKIKNGLEPPLRPATIAARRRRSAGSTYRRKATTAAEVRPLIDTGQLLRSLTYVVRDKVG